MEKHGKVLEILTVEEVLAQVTSSVNHDLKLRLFKLKGTSCIECGIKGTSTFC